jgi:hypothetical protein
MCGGNRTTPRKWSNMSNNSVVRIRKRLSAGRTLSGDRAELWERFLKRIQELQELAKKEKESEGPKDEDAASVSDEQGS